MRKVGNRLWTVVTSVAQSIAANSDLDFDILDDTDWRQGSAANRGTVQRVRGWVSVMNKIATGSFAKATYHALLLLTDDDAPTVDASAPTTYTDEDVLWTGGGQLPFQDSGDAHVCHIEVDSKSQRRVRSGQVVTFNIHNTSATAAEIALVLRCLVRV